MEKIINKLINEFTQGVDTYTHNGSTWLIFTETKQWVVELTKDKTLWYNYNFFKGIFSYTSMDVVDNQQYITKWVEDNIINKELTYATLFRDARDRKQQFEDTLENGVRHTDWGPEMNSLFVDDALENGVKKTKGAKMKTDWSVEDTIQNGVKETRLEMNITEGEVDDIIQDGVKETIECDWNIPKYVINEVVNDGVKYTFPNSEMGTSNDVEDTLKNGVKQTYSLGSLEVTEKEINNTLENGVRDTQYSGYENKSWIEGVIKEGVKETKSAIGKYFEEVQDVLDNSVRNSHPLIYRTKDMIDKVIDKGIKETHREICEYKETIGYIIQTGVKETHDDVYHHKGRIDGVINNGVKETKEMLDWVCTDRMLSNILENGIKETKTPGNGDIVSTVEWMKENNSTSYLKMIDDVIDNGVKEVVSYDEHKRGPVNTFGYIDDIIENGVKKTLKVENGTFTSIGFDGQCENVIKNGILKTKDMDEWVNTPRIVGYVIENGVKEIKGHGFEQQNIIDDIVKDGEKINGTYAGGQRQSEKCKSVVEYGTKNPTY